MAIKPSAPGWYADPQGESRYRYWDGQAWTGRVAANVREVRFLNEGRTVEPSTTWTPAYPPPKEEDWFDKLLPWLVEDEETGKTPAGQLLFFVSWIALTVFLLSGGC